MAVAMSDETRDRSSPAPNPSGNNQHTAVPAMFNHCRQVYDEMCTTAVEYWADSGTGDPRPLAVAEHPEPPYQGAVTVTVWEGFLTKLVNEKLQFSTPYFSHVRNNLIAMGCIRQLQRGGGSSPSRWELIQEPDLDKFTAIKEETGSSYGAVGRHLRSQDPGSVANRKAEAAGQQARDTTKTVELLQQTVTIQTGVVNAILAALETAGVRVNLDNVGTPTDD